MFIFGWSISKILRPYANFYVSIIAYENLLSLQNRLNIDSNLLASGQTVQIPMTIWKTSKAIQPRGEHEGPSKILF